MKVYKKKISTTGNEEHTITNPMRDYAYSSNDINDTIEFYVKENISNGITDENISDVKKNNNTLRYPMNLAPRPGILEPLFSLLLNNSPSLSQAYDKLSTYFPMNGSTTANSRSSDANILSLSSSKLANISQQVELMDFHDSVEVRPETGARSKTIYKNPGQEEDDSRRRYKRSTNKNSTVLEIQKEELSVLLSDLKKNVKDNWDITSDSDPGFSEGLIRDTLSQFRDEILRLKKNSGINTWESAPSTLDNFIDNIVWFFDNYHLIYVPVLKNEIRGYWSGFANSFTSVINRDDPAAVKAYLSALIETINSDIEGLDKRADELSNPLINNYIDSTELHFITYMKGKLTTLHDWYEKSLKAALLPPAQLYDIFHFSLKELRRQNEVHEGDVHFSELMKSIIYSANPWRTDDDSSYFRFNEAVSEVRMKEYISTVNEMSEKLDVALSSDNEDSIYSELLRFMDRLKETKMSNMEDLAGIEDKIYYSNTGRLLHFFKVIESWLTSENIITVDSAESKEKNDITLYNNRNYVLDIPTAHIEYWMAYYKKHSEIKALSQTLLPQFGNMDLRLNEASKMMLPFKENLSEQLSDIDFSNYTSFIDTSSKFIDTISQEKEKIKKMESISTNKIYPDEQRRNFLRLYQIHEPLEYMIGLCDSWYQEMTLLYADIDNLKHNDSLNAIKYLLLNPGAQSYIPVYDTDSNLSFLKIIGERIMSDLDSDSIENLITSVSETADYYSQSYANILRQTSPTDEAIHELSLAYGVIDRLIRKAYSANDLKKIKIDSSDLISEYDKAKRLKKGKPKKALSKLYEIESILVKLTGGNKDIQANHVVSHKMIGMLIDIKAFYKEIKQWEDSFTGLTEDDSKLYFSIINMDLLSLLNDNDTYKKIELLHTRLSTLKSESEGRMNLELTGVISAAYQSKISTPLYFNRLDVYDERIKYIEEVALARNYNDGKAVTELKRRQNEEYLKKISFENIIIVSYAAQQIEKIKTDNDGFYAYLFDNIDDIHSFISSDLIYSYTSDSDGVRHDVVSVGEYLTKDVFIDHPLNKRTDVNIYWPKEVEPLRPFIDEIVNSVSKFNKMIQSESDFQKKWIAAFKMVPSPLEYFQQFLDDISQDYNNITISTPVTFEYSNYVRGMSYFGQAEPQLYEKTYTLGDILMGKERLWRYEMDPVAMRSIVKRNGVSDKLLNKIEEKDIYSSALKYFTELFSNKHVENSFMDYVRALTYFHDVNGLDSYIIQEAPALLIYPDLDLGPKFGTKLTEGLDPEYDRIKVISLFTGTSTEYPSLNEFKASLQSQLAEPAFNFESTNKTGKVDENKTNIDFNSHFLSTFDFINNNITVRRLKGGNQQGILNRVILGYTNYIKKVITSQQKIDAFIFADRLDALFTFMSFAPMGVVGSIITGMVSAAIPQLMKADAGTTDEERRLYYNRAAIFAGVSMGMDVSILSGINGIKSGIKYIKTVKSNRLMNFSKYLSNRDVAQIHKGGSFVFDYVKPKKNNQLTKGAGLSRPASLGVQLVPQDIHYKKLYKNILVTREGYSDFALYTAPVSPAAPPGTKVRTLFISAHGGYMPNVFGRNWIDASTIDIPSGMSLSYLSPHRAVLEDQGPYFYNSNFVPYAEVSLANQNDFIVNPHQTAYTGSRPRPNTAKGAKGTVDSGKVRNYELGHFNDNPNELFEAIARNRDKYEISLTNPRVQMGTAGLFDIVAIKKGALSTDEEIINFAQAKGYEHVVLYHCRSNMLRPLLGARNKNGKTRPLHINFKSALKRTKNPVNKNGIVESGTDNMSEISFKKNKVMSEYTLQTLTPVEASAISDTRDIVSGIYNEYLKSPSEKCEVAAKIIYSLLKENEHYTNVKIINMGIWDTAYGMGADMYNNHWVIAGTYDGIELVLDPSAHQFAQMLGIKEPILTTKNNWLAQYQNAFNKKRMILAKLKEVNNFSSAPFLSSGQFSGFKYIEDAEIISSSRWYSQYGYNQYIKSLPETQRLHEINELSSDLSKAGPSGEVNEAMEVIPGGGGGKYMISRKDDSLSQKLGVNTFLGIHNKQQARHENLDSLPVIPGAVSNTESATRTYSAGAWKTVTDIKSEVSNVPIQVDINGPWALAHTPGAQPDTLTVFAHGKTYDEGYIIDVPDDIMLHFYTPHRTSLRNPSAASFWHNEVTPYATIEGNRFSISDFKDPGKTVQVPQDEIRDGLIFWRDFLAKKSSKDRFLATGAKKEGEMAEYSLTSVSDVHDRDDFISTLDLNRAAQRPDLVRDLKSALKIKDEVEFVPAAISDFLFIDKKGDEGVLSDALNIAKERGYKEIRLIHCRVRSKDKNSLSYDANIHRLRGAELAVKDTPYEVSIDVEKHTISIYPMVGVFYSAASNSLHNNVTAVDQ